MAFGFTGPRGVEPSHALFQDGPGAGAVDFIEWQTEGWINLNGFALHLQQDGAGIPDRGASSFALVASQDGPSFSMVSGGTIPGGPGGNDTDLLDPARAFIAPSAAIWRCAGLAGGASFPSMTGLG